MAHRTRPGPGRLSGLSGKPGLPLLATARARELVDQGTPIEAACRIVILEDQLEEAQRINAEHLHATESTNPTNPTNPMNPTTEP
ncbi:hypothetical protein GCM10010449_02550 [Streptomyces rectiviolaceus]|uniref:MerR family transcriptional regulator n=1 Tax=Streptomyces rectiviolaceus TaxID=332591 RepID=A0ABP6M7Y6_9ACTN